MTDSVDFRCIVAPKGAGEVRIPGLVTLVDERTVLFFDERPAPASGTGSDFNGLTMASDLPNPNRILWMVREGAGQWSEPHPLPAGGPPVSSDACVGVDGDGFLHLAFASTDGRVGYMDSRADGERLRAWWAWGSGPEDLAYVDMTDELYELTGADALFATSGGTVALGGAVARPTSCAWGMRRMCASSTPARVASSVRRTRLLATGECSSTRRRSVCGTVALSRTAGSRVLRDEAPARVTLRGETGTAGRVGAYGSSMTRAAMRAWSAICSCIRVGATRGPVARFSV